MGSLGKTSRKFWRMLRGAGVEIRVHNPPQLSKPLHWLSRNHRKTLIVDGAVGFVTGLCVRGAGRWPDLLSRRSTRSASLFPAAVVGLWGGLALLWTGIQLRRRSKQAPAAVVKEPEAS
jgi:phosphatidylserine/phosphatidylglycerophosphate/cardiolipin synthase-like enzyme